MAKKTIALFHPGNMGATIGAAAAASGARVLWASHERGAATRRRAERAGLFDAGTLADALRQADVVLSVCPPHAALDVARAVAAERFSGIYVDANAISRATAEQIGVLEDAVLHSDFFGERTLTARSLAASLVGTLARREPEDLAILNKYLHGVVEPRGKEQGGAWPEFLEGGREAIAKLA